MCMLNSDRSTPNRTANVKSGTIWHALLYNVIVLLLAPIVLIPHETTGFRLVRDRSPLREIGDTETGFAGMA